MITQLRKKAAQWRREEKEFALPLSGYVVIYRGKPFGWAANPDVTTYCPGVLAVPNNGAILIAKGGDDSNGAEVWEKFAT